MHSLCGVLKEVMTRRQILAIVIVVIVVIVVVVVVVTNSLTYDILCVS